MEWSWKHTLTKHGKTMCGIMFHVISLMWMARSTHLWQLFLPYFIVCCVGSLWGLSLCWCVIGVQGVDTWDAFYWSWTRYQSENWFALVHIIKPRKLFLQLNSKKYIFLGKVICIGWGFEGLQLGNYQLGTHTCGKKKYNQASIIGK